MSAFGVSMSETWAGHGERNGSGGVGGVCFGANSVIRKGRKINRS